MTEKPQVDFEEVVKASGMPVTEEEIRDRFNAIATEEGIITNTSRMSPFWRLVTAIVTAPVMWLKEVLISTVLANMFVATASGSMLRLLAWAVNITPKPASAAQGVIRFYKEDASAVVTVKAGTVIQTERINGRVYELAITEDVVMASGTASALLPVKATGTGGAYNLAPGYYRILPVAVDGISHVASEENWLTVPGADEESDDELRERCRNQFNLVGNYHTDAVYRSMIESHYPELASGLHLPKLARVVAPSEAVKSGNFADPFRPRYAVDVQLLDADGNPDNQTPVYSAVPLPVPMAGNDSGMFQFPPEGTLVEVAFTGGRPDKPFIRQTLPDGTSLPDIKPGEQLQQQRAEVSQRVTQAGDWVRQTDQTISETSMARTVKADTERRELVSRETTVKATDKITVLGTATLMAGAIQQVSAGDFSQAVKGNRLASITGNEETEIAGQLSTKVAGAMNVDVGGTLTEKIAALRKSVAAGGQQIMGPTVHIGSEGVNTLTMMLDTIDLLAELAQQCASHSHPSVGTPTNAGAFNQTAAKAGQTRSKYQNIIA
ncbi:hypothetical protein AA26_21510 [Salmonella enterica subsp. enterica]|nr:hypothetical protein [Salmonella enterica]EBA4612173.1 hypothetical protein [Salmonella enterica]EBP4394506.1 hypothetical protein [Salmonella enterica subsp. enterica]